MEEAVQDRRLHGVKGTPNGTDVLTGLAVRCTPPRVVYVYSHILGGQPLHSSFYPPTYLIRQGLIHPHLLMEMEAQRG